MKNHTKEELTEALRAVTTFADILRISPVLRWPPKGVLLAFSSSVLTFKTKSFIKLAILWCIGTCYLNYITIRVSHLKIVIRADIANIFYISKGFRDI